jgi:Zn-finger nucleic acid-binding protein
MARCVSCSAPLEGYTMKCGYCGTRNDIDLTGIHEFTGRAPESSRICPRCTVTLKTIDLEIDGPFFIERCDRCLGMFFDPGEVQALLEKTVKNVFSIDYKKLAALQYESGRRESVVQYIKCPVCGELMNRVNFGAKSGVIVDQCRPHGVWLDCGELKQLMEWKKFGGELLEKRLRADRAREKQEEEERKKSEHVSYITRAQQQAGADALPFLSPSRREPDLLELMCGLVGRLFR